jgi:hypothetical protein
LPLIPGLALTQAAPQALRARTVSITGTLALVSGTAVAVALALAGAATGSLIL